MARRSATNARYGKHTAPTGKTRKSAAAAKPKRSGSSAPKPSKSSGPKGARQVPINPDTPEYKRWRGIWWGFLGLSIVLVAVTWFLPREGDKLSQTSWIVLGVAYASIFAAVIIDFFKLRKLRSDWLKEQSAPKSKSQAKKEAKDDASEKGASADKDTTDQS